jgi:YD repeat-containing protein
LKFTETGEDCVERYTSYDPNRNYTLSNLQLPDPGLQALQLAGQTAEPGVNLAAQCSVASGSTTRTYSYNVLGQLTSGTQVTNSVTHPFSYSYDLQGNVKSITYPSGRVITYGLSGAGATNERWLLCDNGHLCSAWSVERSYNRQRGQETVAIGRADRGVPGYGAPVGSLVSCVSRAVGTCTLRTVESHGIGARAVDLTFTRDPLPPINSQAGAMLA